MYLGQFFDPNLMMDLAQQTQEYQEAVETGPQPETPPATTPTTAEPTTVAGMSPVTLLLIGGSLLWLMTKK